MLKYVYGVAAAAILSGCGAVYMSSKVDLSDDTVQVAPLTTQSVQTANLTTYRPKQIPDVFFQIAGGGSQARSFPPAPLPSLNEEQRPLVLTSRLPPVVNPGPYRIGIGDVVLLATKASGGTVEELSGLLAAQNRRQGYTVQDDGAIAVPGVGRVGIADRTLEEAEAELFQRLVENQIDPTFSLEIAEFNSRQVSVGGAVSSPAIVPVRLTPLTLDEALTRAGGVATADVNFASIRIYRSGSLYQIPLTQYLAEPATQKTRLLAGDSVFVDTAFELDKARAYFEEQITLAQFRQQSRVQALNELQAEIALRRAALAEERSNFEARVALDAVDRDYVYLTGEFKNPGRFPLPFGRQATLADAIYSDGGFSVETGNPGQIYVLRGEAGGLVTAWHLDARNISNMILATKMNILPNDIVFIAEQPITRWNRVIQQIVPSLITTTAGIASR